MPSPSPTSPAGSQATNTNPPPDAASRSPFATRPGIKPRHPDMPRRPYQCLPFPVRMLHAPTHTEATSPPTAHTSPGTDFDGHWKDALASLLAPCMVLFWPDLHDAVDWNSPLDFLDKELRALNPGRRRNRRYPDKLVRVRLRNGAPALMLLHEEIQQRLAGHFAKRMYSYFARLYETYPDTPILQFAIITRSPGRASHLHYDYAPEGKDFLSLAYRVPVVHLQSWADQENELQARAPDNPFAVVVLAELAAARRDAPQVRLEAKTRLVRNLYQYGWPAARVRQLFLFIDGILALPPALDEQFWQSLANFEEERNVAYISSVERIGIKKGLTQGLETGRHEGMAGLLREQLEVRFGPLSAADLQRLQLADGTTLRAWGRRLLDARTLEGIWH